MDAAREARRAGCFTRINKADKPGSQVTRPQSWMTPMLKAAGR